MKHLVLSILTAALGASANPSASNDGPGNHNQDTDLGGNKTNIELEERGNSRTWGGFADSCTDIQYYLSDRDMKRYEIGEPTPNSAVGVKPYLDLPVIVARCPNAMMHHTTHHAPRNAPLAGRVKPTARDAPFG